MINLLVMNLLHDKKQNTYREITSVSVRMRTCP